MKQYLCLKLKKFIFRNSREDKLLDKIQELENKIEKIKLQLNDTQAVKIEKIIVEKIICEKLETNYKIDSMTIENLSGTMNIGTIYPVSKPKIAINKEEKPLDHSEIGEPKVNVVYK